MKLTENLKYVLHDTDIDKIVCTDKGISLRFANGVYLLDEIGHETDLSDPCRLDITISEFDDTRMFEHITVIKTVKSKSTEIEFADFSKLVEKNTFRIDVDYYSFFASSILLKGYCDIYGIELVITEIEKAEYVFDE